MTTLTLADVEARFDFRALDYLNREASVPVVTMDAPAPQGDVLIRPAKNATAAAKAIPQAGVVVATGQGGHDHTLVGPGTFDPRSSTDGLLVGVLTVPADAEVLLTHPEHGAFTVAEGTYEIRTQREYAGVWQAVRD